MVQTVARIKKLGKNFEVIVDLDKALAFKNGKGGNDFLEIDKIFKDSKKGFNASDEDIKEAFGTDDVNSVAEKIVKQGEILLTQEHRDEERDKKLKQIVDFLAKNAINPQSGLPHTAERIRSALEEARITIKNSPIESQINDIVNELKKIIPIRIATKKIKIKIPAIHTGKVYGIINPYKESEEWLSNGDLDVIVNVPAGIVIDFYDKLNSATHGSALTEEIKE